MSANKKKKESDYDAYYNSEQFTGAHKTTAPHKPTKKKARCPYCDTVASHKIIKFVNNSSILDCVFCSKTFPALGNCT